jgi:pimeloyl-ACP methyl ester carboxylesterase
MRLILILTTMLLLSACGGSSSNSDGDTEPGALLRSSVLNEYKVSENTFLTLFSVISGRNYDVKVVKLVYKTTLENGDKVNASGIVAIPQGKTTPSPMLSYQHGTIFLDSAVPSNNPSFDTSPLLAASAGFVVVATDYIGYGESKSLTHPYIQAIPSANSVIDLLRAARSYLQSQSVELNQQLFLAGYSEGGYATIAAHQRMQTLYADEFTVTASIAGAGPYDVRGMTDEILLNQSTLSQPAYFSFVVHAYDTWYDLDNLTLRAIQSPYDRVLDSRYNGDYSSAAVNSVLPRAKDELFDPAFLSEYAGLAGELTLKYRLEDNNVYDWAPSAPVRLFHGQNDDIVPYQNAATALASMQANGAADVTLDDCNAVPSTHVNCAASFALYLTSYLLSEAEGR